jgi:hypothetical protein
VYDNRRHLAKSWCDELLKVWGWLRDHIVKATIVAALSASAVAYVKGAFDKIIGDVLPKGAEISCVGREWIVDHSPFRQPGPSKQAFRIPNLTEAVVRAFQGHTVDRPRNCVGCETR